MPCLPDVISRWILCFFFPSSVLVLPWKSFILVTACSPSFLATVQKERFFYGVLFERWLWPVPPFFPSFLLLCALKKRWIDPNDFTVLVLISAFQKEIFCKGSPCYTNQNYFSGWYLNLIFFIARSTSNTVCREVEEDVILNNISAVVFKQALQCCKGYRSKLCTLDWFLSKTNKITATNFCT